MLTTITVIAGFSVGAGLFLIPLFFAFRSKSFGKDMMFMMGMGLVMIGLATWQLIKPEPVTGYIPFDDAEQAAPAPTE